MLLLPSLGVTSRVSDSQHNPLLSSPAKCGDCTQLSLFKPSTFLMLQGPARAHGKLQLQSPQQLDFTVSAKKVEQWADLPVYL